MLRKLSIALTALMLWFSVLFTITMARSYLNNITASYTSPGYMGFLANGFSAGLMMSLALLVLLTLLVTRGPSLRRRSHHVKTTTHRSIDRVPFKGLAIKVYKGGRTMRFNGGHVFAGTIILGVGIGMIFGRPDIGAIIGTGLGFIAMALVNRRR